MLAILVPVVFGLMGFAVDLGRIYMARGEIKAAANAMALAAAAQLMGTDASLDAAASAGQLALSSSGGLQNRYDFGGLAIGETSGVLTSEAGAPAYFETVAAALAADSASEAAGATARHVRIRITADAPLVFWGFLSLGNERKTPIAVEAVAGVSAPLCTACGVDMIAIAAADTADEADFGFIRDTRYTLGFQCFGAPTPSQIAGTATRIPFLIVNRFNADAQIFAEENTQAYRIGLAGLPASTVAAQSCLAVNSTEAQWESATALPCNQNRVPAAVTAMTCGFSSRFEVDVPTNCQTIAESETLGTLYQPDTDIADVETYAAYTGNGRRVITVAIVASLAAPTAMTVLGFRQFLLEPNPNTTNISTLDPNARFPALYIGSVVPLRQGSFSGCSIASGPGKVVLHR